MFMAKEKTIKVKSKKFKVVPKKGHLKAIEVTSKKMKKGKC